jgi:hypothetical protein
LAGVAALSAWLLPATAQAVQAHGDPEGLVAHQLGHALFVLGVVVILVQLGRGRARGPGWRWFRLFLWLIILWNAVAFGGHLLNEVVDSTKISNEDGRNLSMSLTNLTDWLFYLSRFDHALLVPAFLCLLVALRRWRRPR